MEMDLAAMDPAVQAAWIAAVTSVVSLAGTVLVAFFGFRAADNVGKAANNAAVQNTKHFVNATRDDHLWEKRARAYEETLAHVTFASLRREINLRAYRLDDDSEGNIEALFKAYQPDSWFAVQGRMLAYASDEVMAAFTLSSEADNEATIKFNAWQTKAHHNRQIAHSGATYSQGFSGEDMIKTRDEALAAAKAVQECDKRLMEIIRSELRGHPKTAD